MLAFGLQHRFTVPDVALYFDYFDARKVTGRPSIVVEVSVVTIIMLAVAAVVTIIVADSDFLKSAW